MISVIKRERKDGWMERSERNGLELKNVWEASSLRSECSCFVAVGCCGLLWVAVGCCWLLLVAVGCCFASICVVGFIFLTPSVFVGFIFSVF